MSNPNGNPNWKPGVGGNPSGLRKDGGTPGGAYEGRRQALKLLDEFFKRPETQAAIIAAFEAAIAKNPMQFFEKFSHALEGRVGQIVAVGDPGDGKAPLRVILSSDEGEELNDEDWGQTDLQAYRKRKMKKISKEIQRLSDELAREKDQAAPESTT
jgi:hypothetical protein